MVSTDIKLSISAVAAVGRPLAIPRAAWAEPRSRSQSANGLEIGEAEMRLCHADSAAGTGARRANAAPAYLTSELVLPWRGVARGCTDNAFRRLQRTTGTDSDRLNAARRPTLLGTTVSEPACEGLGARLPACWRMERAACRKQSKQMQARTPRDDAGERSPHVERFTQSSARRAKNARQMVRCGLGIYQEERSSHQRPLLDAGLRNGKVVRHGFARTFMTHQFLTHFKPTVGRGLNSESGSLGDPSNDGRGAAA